MSRKLLREPSTNVYVYADEKLRKLAREGSDQETKWKSQKKVRPNAGGSTSAAAAAAAVVVNDNPIWRQLLNEYGVSFVTKTSTLYPRLRALYDKRVVATSENKAFLELWTKAVKENGLSGYIPKDHPSYEDIRVTFHRLVEKANEEAERKLKAEEEAEREEEEVDLL